MPIIWVCKEYKAFQLFPDALSKNPDIENY